MRPDRILAALLIVACLAAALSHYRGGGATEAEADRAFGPGAEVGIIDVYGTISDASPDDGLFGSASGAGALRLMKAIRSAEKDGVKALLVRINSPGGTAAASQMVYQELMRLRKAGKIKIVAAMGDVAASGGYYIAAAADHIVAAPATTTGSIGVIMHLQNVQGLMGKLGVSSTTVQSGPRKDILSPFRALRADERSLLQAMVDDTYGQFLGAVVEGRKMPLERLRPLADGRVYTGAQARQVGLVDSLGTYQDALAKAASLAGIKDEPSTRNYSGGGMFGDLLPRLESRLPSWLGADPKLSWNKIPLTILE